MYTSLTFISIITVLAGRVSSYKYKLETSIVGEGFYDNFDFQAIPDPTNGFVTFVDEPTAIAANLSFATDKTFIMRADSTAVLDPNGPGRQSIRIQSNGLFGNGTVAILDLAHMPQGCGTWPAFWSLGPNWPSNGEIDILEGVNDQTPNQSTLHTEPGCTMPPSNSIQTGTTVSTDCDAFDNGNSGCGVKAPTASSYGPAFNQNGGGWYVMERTNTHIAVWFWARNDPTVPEAVASGSPHINTATFGAPYAYFGNSQCDIPTFFGPHNFVFDLTFCGDFAGNPGVYAASGCPSTCNAFVAGNPQALTGAYWEVNSLNMYTSYTSML